jgi:lipid-A-disaccharide synthase-like uncharacterized protein
MEEIPFFWHILGIGGAIIFYGRFWVQWIASEIKKQSLIPNVFWYMSSVGSLMLLAYAALTQSPLGTLSQNLNIIIYGRNLVHIWKNDKSPSKMRIVLIHIIMVITAVTGAYFVVHFWWDAWNARGSSTPDNVLTDWQWLLIGLVGQALFMLRFLIQWIVTERKKESVIPVVFWYLSIAAASLQGMSFAQREEWVFAVGMAATVGIYLRNLWFIHHSKSDKLI